MTFLSSEVSFIPEHSQLCGGDDGQACWRWRNEEWEGARQRFANHRAQLQEPKASTLPLLRIAYPVKLSIHSSSQRQRADACRLLSKLLGSASPSDNTLRTHARTLPSNTNRCDQLYKYRSGSNKPVCSVSESPVSIPREALPYF